MMGQYLSFITHVDYIFTNGNGFLFLLSENKDLLDDNLRNVGVDSQIRSLFSYCLAIWGGDKSNVDKKNLLTTRLKHSHEIAKCKENLSDMQNTFTN